MFITENFTNRHLMKIIIIIIIVFGRMKVILYFIRWNWLRTSAHAYVSFIGRKVMLLYFDLKQLMRNILHLIFLMWEVFIDTPSYIFLPWKGSCSYVLLPSPPPKKKMLLVFSIWEHDLHSFHSLKILVCLVTPCRKMQWETKKSLTEEFFFFLVSFFSLTSYFLKRKKGIQLLGNICDACFII